jgi:hypothetical protein
MPKNILRGLLCASAWGLLLSCATLSPAVPGPVPPRAETPEELVPQWLPLAVFPGGAGESGGPAIGCFAGRVRSPRLEIWALRIDLEDPALEVVVNGPEPVEGLLRRGYIPSVTVGGFVERGGYLAGINTNPFSPASGKTGEERHIDGIAVSRGRLVSDPHPSFDALVFYRAGGAAIVSQTDLSPEALEGIDNAVGGFYRVLENGELPRAVLEGSQNRHPRSAAGISADGRYLYLLVVDGRRPGSAGATLAELGLLLKRLGAAGGINFDGGGSTALALRYPGGRVRVLNTPVHDHIPGWERGVAICLGIKAAAGP